MIKSSLYISALACLACLTACEKTETALIEDEAVQQSAAQINTQASTQAPIRIDANPPVQKKQAPTYTDTAPAPAPADLAKPVRTAQHSVPAHPTLAPTMAPAASRPVRSTPFRVQRCMNMGNALEAENEGDWGYRITSRDLRAVAAAGFDTVRIPVRWDTHTAHRAPYAVDTSFMARIKNVVRDAQAAGLGVIIDVHHYENLMTRTDREEPRFLAIWDQIARAFADAPSNVYFEVLNEPTLEISNARINALYAKVLPIIRRTNPARKVIIGGNSWNSVESLSEVRWPLFANKRDANLVATFHDYGPHEFTHQGAEWSEPVMPMGRRWGGKPDMVEMSNIYKIARKFKAKTGLPIFVGEFGVINKVPLAQRNQWVKARRKTIEANGFSWCAWDFSGAFKSYDTSARKWLPGTQDAFFGR